MIDVFLLNAIVYWLTLLLIVYKNRVLNLYVLVWLLNTIIATASYYCISNGIYYTPDKYLGYKVSITPYIYIYLTIHVLTYPIKKINISSYNFVYIYRSTLLNYIANISLVVFTFITVLRALEAYTAYAVGFGEAYSMAHSQGERLVEYSNPFLRAISQWGSTYYELFMSIVAIVFLLKLLKKKGKKYRNILGVLLTFLPAILGALSYGSKGGLFFVFFDICFFYLLIHHLLSDRIKHLVFMYGISFLALLFIGAFAIDESRIENSNRNITASEAILTYLGEAMPNVGHEFYGKVTHHPYGRRFYPELFGTKSDKEHQQGADKQTYWRNKTGVEIQMFKTFWGDCYIEYSTMGAAIYIFILTLLWYLLVFRKCKGLHMIPLVYYYYHFFLISGIFGHGFSGTRRHLLLLYTIIICVLLKILIKEEQYEKSY